MAEEKVSVIDYSKEVIKVTRDLNKAKADLKRLNKKFELYGSDITESDIQRQEKLVKFYEETLKQLTQQSSRTEEQELQAKIESKQKQLEDLTGRKDPSELTAGEKVGAIKTGRINQPKKTTVENIQEDINDLQTSLNAIKPQEPANQTDKAKSGFRFGPGTSMDDLLGGAKRKTKTFINVPENSLIVRNTDGTFDVNDVKSIFVYDRSQNILQPQSIDAFINGLYTLTPNAITEYKKGFGYKAEDINGVLTDRFTQDIVDAAKAVSEYSFGYAQSGLKAPIDLIQYLSNSQSYPEINSIVKQQKSGGTGTAIDANRLAANVDTVRLLETEIGVSLNEKQRAKIAKDLATGRVNATTLPSTIAQAGKLSLDEGEAAGLKAELKQNAAINGVDLGEAWFDRTTQNILQGKMVRETANTEILKQAKMKYAAPSLVAGLDAGFTIRDQVTQNINWLAQMRGVDPESISLNDPILAKALMNMNDKGMPVQMDFINWENWAKENDPAYATSSMAEEQYSSALRVMGQAFGKSI